MTGQVAVVDLFSGPGGLGEGFASLELEDGTRPYDIRISIEKERSAHRTLRLRAFLRKLPSLPAEYVSWLAKGGDEPDWARIAPEAWGAADREARCIELGTSAANALLEERISEIEASGSRHTLLIGGPPCQAYSLAGRSRNAGIVGYDPTRDERNFLYQKYCEVLERLQPSAFVMENVKGILSSSVGGKAVFSGILRDLRGAGPGYVLLPLAAPRAKGDDVSPKDFLIRAEDHGVAQRRHRVIILGLRCDVAAALGASNFPCLEKAKKRVSVAEVISGLPELRSGLSRSDTTEAWNSAFELACERVERGIFACNPAIRAPLQAALRELSRTRPDKPVARASRQIPVQEVSNSELMHWIRRPALEGLSLHNTRGHMPSDLGRYLFAALYGKVLGVSPRAGDFPDILAPDHRNWHSGKFNDRFRVQLQDEPATTVTSHISKDGHYFIHPDPAQCRSLTVREAARLQSFPDDYHFLGNRTEQFVQVGNAVPPFLARQIATALLPVFGADPSRIRQMQ